MKDITIDKDMIFNRTKDILVDLVYSGDDVRKSKRNGISLETDIFTDLGIDSVESLDFLTALEEEFGVNPDQFEANQKRTVSQIVDYVVTLLKQKRAQKNS